MYRNVYWHQEDKCLKVRTWDKNGNRVTVNVSFKPYLYVDSPAGEYKSIFDEPIAKKVFNTPFERSRFIKNYGTDRFYDNFSVEQQFLLDTFYKVNDDPNFAKNPLRILWWDIEVDPLPDESFPDAEHALAEINIITAYDTLDQKYHVFSKYPYNGSNLADNVVFNNCGSEKNLIAEFVAFWKSNDYPDQISAWNGYGYDVPYLRNRIIKLFGIDYWLSLSPYGIIREVPAEDKMGRQIIKYDIAGIDNLEYIDVYIKFKIVKQESYKLDFIAEQEIGYGKVDYDGMTIGQFMTKCWDRFVEYNVRDVELLVKLEERLHYFQLLRRLGNLGLCNYPKALMTIPIVNGNLAIRARRQNKVLHTFIKHPTEQDKPGGFVSSNAGLHRIIGVWDASSLYPSIIRSLNISPETKVGMVYFRENASSYDLYSFANEVKLISTKGRKFDLTKEQFYDFVKKNKLNVAFNGALFRTDKEGLLKSYMSDLYNQRVTYKNEMKKHIKENEKLEEELKKIKERAEMTKEEIENGIKKIEKQIALNNIKIVECDVAQGTLKVALNSAYGAISAVSNPVSDVDLANAITMSGSNSIQQVNKIAVEFIKKKRKELILKEIDDINKITNTATI